MAKPAPRFVCQPAAPSPPNGPAAARPAGSGTPSPRNPSTPRPRPAQSPAATARKLAFVDLAGTAEPPPRAPIGIAELDRVLGGGLVPARPCCSAATPASANPPCCCRPPPPSPPPASACCTSPARKRSNRSACAPAASASPRPARTRRRDQPARHRRQPGGRARRHHGGDRQHPDHVDRQHRQRPRHRQPGARRRFELIRLAKSARLLRGAGRPCHQGRRHRRPARAGAHGRCGAVFRRRPRPPVPHPARGEEPLRRHRRDRRVRNDRPRPRRSAQPLAPCSSPSAAATSRAARCSPGWRARRPVLVEVQACSPPTPAARRAARWSAGMAAGWPCCWRCWKPVAACGSTPRTSTSTSPAACASPSRPPTSPSPPPWPRPPPTGRPIPAWCFSARSACPARCARSRRPRRG